MNIYVGTSGWVYSWNPDGFEWYIRNSGLNTVELNSSFYRFPYPNQVRGWMDKTVKYDGVMRWSVKIHRSISHYKRLNEKAVNTWIKFKNLFKPLDEYIDFYLLQLPPRFMINKRNIEKLRSFVGECGLEDKLAVEFRHYTWFNEEAVELARDMGFTYVSVDSPESSYIASSNRIIYLRMHGRTEWYIHYYTDEELKEIVSEILRTEPEKIYVYFNNNHDMLENSRRMKKLLEEHIS